jgi:acetyl-CoA carboxylase biotin carboxyl carrier protein
MEQWSNGVAANEHASNTPALQYSMKLEAGNRRSRLDLAGKCALPKRLIRAPAAVDLKDIKAIIDLMRKNDLSVFEMEKDGFRLKLQKGVGDQPAMPAPIVVSSAPALAAPGATATAAEPSAAATGLKDIVAPMVGTFYRAASPDAPAFADVGKPVTEDSVVCIIEAMKVMNEIKAETSGVIAEVVAENGKPVQFGQVLFRIR